MMATFPDRMTVTVEVAEHLPVFLPSELRHEKDAIASFFDAMVYKLRKNVHKPGFKEVDVKVALDLLRREVEELVAAIHEGNAVEILLEAADIANFAMIAANAALEGRK